jgi:predicted helicase
VRANPKLSGTKHNVFGIQTGVAICYLVRKTGVEGCTIRYVRRPEDETAEDKLGWLGSGEIKLIDFTSIKPDRQHSWINLAENDFDELLPIHAKAGGLNGVFDLYSMGIVTARDEWVYDEDRNSLASKTEFLISTFNHQREGLKSIKKGGKIDYDVSIKWSESLKRNLITTKSDITFDSSRIVEACYRPFNNVNYYNDVVFSDRLTNLHFQIFGDNLSTKNASISLMGDSSGKPFFTLAIIRPPDLNFVSPASGGTRCLPRYRYTKSGEQVDNITDWAVKQFVGHYAYNPSPLAGEGGAPSGAEGVGSGALAPQQNIGAQTRAAPPPQPSPVKGEGVSITKDAIFAYCYAVLHDPVYRAKYALNLKREFPRIPFYPDFDRWVAWGEALLKLHIDYEKVTPATLTRVDTPAPKRAEGTHPKPKLKSNPEAGNIVIDEDTQLTCVPVQAWRYRLGNRSAIDWVLDQHKEKTPRDPTIREKFNHYRFADYKESCIDLLQKVVTVSVDTVAITDAMNALDRTAWAQ